MKQRILFIGESWLGSCARSLKEALARNSDIELDEMAEDSYFPRPRGVGLRVLNRLTLPFYRRDFNAQVLGKIRVARPDVVMTYKGHSIHADLVAAIQKLGPRLVNVYPDCSPHAHGAAHRQAVGAYDLVISTKPFHPGLWQSVYGYQNRCVFVPQGYDPALHLVSHLPTEPRFDVTLVATWRPEYGELMKSLGELLSGHAVTVGIAGHGWAAHRADFPPDWTFAGGLHGRSYIEWLRQGRISLAPVTREVIVGGTRQPGDEDTTRTYELAAAHCFFIHRRTDFVRSLYDDTTEVPMYDTPEELAEKILHFLPRDAERAQMASAAHRRAVPAYSTDSRAKEIATILGAQQHLMKQ